MGVDLLNIEGLKALEHQGPIVMLNLMRFHDRSLDGDGSGWDAYLRYSALTVPMIKARGGTLLWTGDARAVAAEAAQAADRTTPMLAIRGRASFLGERSIGHMDPGSRSASLLIGAAVATLEFEADL